MLYIFPINSVDFSYLLSLISEWPAAMRRLLTFWGEVWKQSSVFPVALFTSLTSKRYPWLWWNISEKSAEICHVNTEWQQLILLFFHHKVQVSQRGEAWFLVVSYFALYNWARLSNRCWAEFCLALLNETEIYGGCFKIIQWAIKSTQCPSVPDNLLGNRLCLMRLIE